MKKMKFVMAIVGMFLSVLLINAEPARADEGITKDEVVIGMITDLSGPIAFLGQNFRDGALMYFRYINEKGGINGRKIKLICEDDGFQTPRTVLAAKKLITKDKVFNTFLITGAGNIMACLPLLKQYKIPLLPTGSSDPGLSLEPYCFVTDPAYPVQSKVVLKYVMETLKSKNAKFGILYSDDLTGQQVKDGYKEQLAKYGIKNVPEQSYKRGATDFSSQMAKLKDAGVTHICGHANAREPALMFKEAQRIQYKPLYMFNGCAGAQKVLELAGDSVNYTNGVYMATPQRDLTKADSWSIKIYKELMKSDKTATLDNPMHHFGFYSAIIYSEALKRAGKNPTREGLMKAAETLKDFDHGMSAHVTWNSKWHGGSPMSIVFKAENGVYVPKTDYVKLDR